MRVWLSLTLLLACSSGEAAPDRSKEGAMATVPLAGPGQAVAVFAGGCFWCLESDFDALPGVVATTSGYAGGPLPHPTYADVTSETSGHKEVVRVVYDTSTLSYEQVLDWFWHHVDPTDGGGQFCDRGDSYETAVYPVDATQKAAAERSKQAITASGVLDKPIVTEIVEGVPFWPAEASHQDFHATNALHYAAYRRGCGRDAGVRRVWAKYTP